MSSRFISSGAIDTKTGDAVPVPAPAEEALSASPPAGNHKSEEWAAVQAQLEADRLQRRRAREEAATASSSSSLYDVLQANRAAKQAAFEEANRIKNQFRPLDDDEVEFLDEVRARRREEEERLRRETEEGLRAFRERQRLVGAAVAEDGVGDGGEAGLVQGTGEGSAAAAAAAAVLGVNGGGGEWSVGRKRKRRKDDHADGIIKGLKRRESSNAATGGAADREGEKKVGAGGAEGEVDAARQDHKTTTATTTTTSTTTATSTTATTATTATASAPPPARPKAGLVDYGSDDDSD